MDSYMAVFSPFRADDWTPVNQSAIPTFQHRHHPTLQIRLTPDGTRCLLEIQIGDTSAINDGVWFISGQMVGEASLQTLHTALSWPDLQIFYRKLAIFCWNAHIRGFSKLLWRLDSNAVLCPTTGQTLSILPDALASEGQTLLRAYRRPFERGYMVLLSLLSLFSLRFPMPQSQHEALQMQTDLERTISCIKR